MNHHMTWFEELTGFPETSADDVRAKLVLDGGTLTSRVNGRSFVCGRLETPSLGELRERVARIAPGRPFSFARAPRIAARGRWRDDAGRISQTGR